MVCRSHLGGQQIQGYLKSSKVLGAGVETNHVPQQLASYSGQPHPQLRGTGLALVLLSGSLPGKMAVLSSFVRGQELCGVSLALRGRSWCLGTPLPNGPVPVLNQLKGE